MDSINSVSYKEFIIVVFFLYSKMGESHNTSVRCECPSPWHTMLYVLGLKERENYTVDKSSYKPQ